VDFQLKKTEIANFDNKMEIQSPGKLISAVDFGDMARLEYATRQITQSDIIL
jgi:hypothetical protein